MMIRELIFNQASIVADQQRKTLMPLHDDVPLLESGLDSLGYAILIANLDDELDVSPFDDDNVVNPVTFGDLIRIYEAAKHSA
jgi:acyl carrier protein